MPGVSGYKGKNTNDRRKNPGKVKSGKLTLDAHGAQAPLGTVTIPSKKGKKGY